MFIPEFSTVGRESKRRQAPREVRTGEFQNAARRNLWISGIAGLCIRKCIGRAICLVSGRTYLGDGRGSPILQTSRRSRCWPYLVQRGAGAGTATAGRFVVDYAALIAAEHALPRRSDSLGSPGNQIADRGNEAITRPRKGVAAFRPLSEDVIQQARLGGGGSTRICAAHSRQGNWVAEIRIGHGIGHGGGVDEAHGGDGRGFVGALAGAEKVRNRDCRNDQNDSDDEQQLDQREPVAVFHGYPRSRQFRTNPGCSTASSRRWDTAPGSIVRTQAEICKKAVLPDRA